MGKEYRKDILFKERRKNKRCSIKITDMPKFSLEVQNNCLLPSVSNEISYKITADDTSCNPVVTSVVVDITSLGENIEWTALSGALPDSSCDVGENRLVTFTLDNPTPFKDMSTTFELTNVKLKANHTAGDSVVIKFKLNLRNYTGDEVTYDDSQIVIKNKKPRIELFRLSPSIVRNLSKVSLAIRCSDIDKYSVIFEKDGTTVSLEGLPPVDPATGKCEGVINNVVVAENRNVLYLRAKLGTAIATENNIQTVRIASNSDWERTALDEIVTTTGSDKVRIYHKIVNLVRNEYDSKIWAFAKHPNKDEIALWNSPDGLVWYPEEIHVQNPDRSVSNVRITIASELANCPAVHFNGKIYFVCGSKADVGKCSNKMRVLDYVNNRMMEDIPGGAGMEERSLHSCVVFPFDKIDNIWVIGGVDKNGNGLRNVWRYNGQEWRSVDVPTDFPQRCLFSATVQTDNAGNKKCIWIAGGMDSYDGDAVKDIWAYNTKWSTGKWSPALNRSGKVLTFTDTGLNASSIVALAADAGQDVSSNTPVSVIDFFLDDTNYSMHYRWLTEQPEVIIDNNRKITPYSFQDINFRSSPNWETQSETTNYLLDTIGFNGCYWMMAVMYKGRGKVDTTDLYFSCPK